MIIPAQALSVKEESMAKGFHENKIKKRHQFNIIKTWPTDFSKVLVEANRHSTLVLEAFYTQSRDLINSKLVHLYYVLIRPNEKNTLTTTINGSQGTIDKKCTIQLDYIEYM